MAQSGNMDPEMRDDPGPTCYGRLKQWPYKTPFFVILLPLTLLPLPLVINTPEAKTGYVMIIMAAFWVTEVIPLSATALIPVVLFPLMGLMDIRRVCANYMKDTIMLFVGGIMVAISLEKCNLHKRIALKILMLIRGNPKWLMLGFMVPTWFLSMWISNTATTAMMLPIANAVLIQMEEQMDSQEGGPEEETQTAKEGHVNEACDIESGEEKIANNIHVSSEEMKNTHVKYSSEDRQAVARLGKGLTICVAYAANVGGTATLTGTGPNIVMVGVTDSIWKSHGLEPPVSFATWMIFGFPGACVLLLVVWLWLQIFYLRKRAFWWPQTKEQKQATQRLFEKEAEKLGPMRYAEIMVTIMFIILVLLWFFRRPNFIPGWDTILEKPEYGGDALPAILIAIVLFFIPERPPSCCRKNAPEESLKSTEMLLDWKIIHERMPWTLVFIIGGGFAMAQAATESGLSKWIGEHLGAFQALPDWLMIMVLCLMVALLTEVTSNTATCTLLMPIVGIMAENAGKNPLYLMFPVAISTSFAFMLPVATPPNAIAFATGRIKVLDMIKAGAILNVLCVLVVTLATQTWGMQYFDLDSLPWGNNSVSATT